MKGFQLLEKLRSCLSTEDYERFITDIDRLAAHKDWAIRRELACLLSAFLHPHAEKSLLSLLEDTNYLVQVEALDSLSSFRSDAVKQAVLSKINSKYALVRGYAYRCISDIYIDNDPMSAKNTLQKIAEKNTWARAMLLISLAQLGDKDACLLLMKMYPRCHYRVRCAILNGLADIYSCLSLSAQADVDAFSQKIAPREIAVQDALQRLKLEIGN